MKCYNHSTADAVGMCKHCSKGICHDCVREVDGCLACAATCVDDVKMINDLIQNNKNIGQTTSGAYGRNAVLISMLGFLFLVWGFLMPEIRGFLFSVGIMFVIGGGFMAYSAMRLRKR